MPERDQPHAAHDRPASGLNWEQSPSSGPPVGGSIGPYKLLSVIGEGGFGIVYLAERREPHVQRVALKVIKPGMDSKEVIARFEAERQALALMDHPNVAKVYDAGATPELRPYFVMEFVAGVPITQYCDTHRLTIDDRLELFTHVCQAIQHAHQNGIIHRDIKPSNILVTLEDGQPVPKVIDFGVAKAISQRLTEKTIFTSLGQLIGTPEYMSPEQAEMTGLNVDTRTDVYSLGVLLYELLTGELPFDRAALRRAAFGEIQRIIREAEPPKPSTRLISRGDESTITARLRQADPRSLVRQLRGDLDWITMKAMEKDRTRRYATAVELAADVQRHREDEPVVAAAPSIGYRAGKFIRRNRGSAVGAAVIVAIMFAATAISLWFGWRATKAEGLAETRLATAEREADKAKAAVEFLRSMLASPIPEAEGREVRVVDLLDDAAARLSQVEGMQPEVEGLIRNALGESYLSLDEYEKANAQLQIALQLRLRAHGPEHLEVADTLSFIAWGKKETGDLDAAENLFRQSLAMVRSLVGDEDALVAKELYNLGVVLHEQGELDEAESTLRNSLSLSRRLGRGDLALAMGHTELARVLMVRGRLAEAEAAVREAIDRLGALEPQPSYQLAIALNILASVLRETDRLVEAEPVAREALNRSREVHGARSAPAASCMVGLAQILTALGRHNDAEQMLRDAADIYTETFGPTHAYVVSTRITLAWVIDAKGDSATAAAMLPDLIEACRVAYAPDHWMVASTRSLYGACLTHAARYGEAEGELLPAHQALSEAGIVDRQRTAALRLSDLYAAWGREEDASLWRQRAESSSQGTNSP